MPSKNNHNQRQNLDFSRFEFKYVLSRQSREDVEAHLQYFVELDAFVKTQPDNKYSVRSLYYDDAHYTAFHDKIDGLLHRRKFRIRTYNDSLSGKAPYFLEVKGRHNNLVFKHRTPIDGREWLQNRGHNLTESVTKHSIDSAVRRQFMHSFFRDHIKPVALITYQRRPYISKFDPDFRITFDDSLKATNADHLFPEGSSQFYDVISGYNVLEIKFNNHLPAWFHRIVQAQNLRRVSISKVCAGMETLGMARDEA